MLYYPVDICENENVLKYFPNIYKFLLSKIKERCNENQTHQEKCLNELNNYFCSVLLDAFMQICAENNEDLFSYINQLNKNLVDNIQNGETFYTFNNGYVPARMYNQAKLKFNLIKIVDAIMERFVNIFNENTHENSLPIKKLLNTIWEDEDVDPNIYLRIYFNELFTFFFNTLNLTLNNKTNTYNEEDLENLTLKQNIEVYLVDAFKTSLKSDLSIAMLLPNDFTNFNI